MALVLADRVRETSTSTGTGTFTLAGAVAGFQSFSAIGTGNTTYYTIATSGDWEVGIGTWTSPDQLSRDTILASTNAGAAVNFGAGTKDVFVTLPSEKAIYAQLNNDALINGVTVGLGGGSTATNLAFGQYALLNNPIGGGYENIAIGASALYANTYGNDNTAIGAGSLGANTTGFENLGIGAFSLQVNDTGYQNVAIGINSLSLNTTGTANLAIGGYAMQYTLSTGCIAIGGGALNSYYYNAGFGNLAIGLNAMSDGNDGNNNIAIGAAAMAGDGIGSYHATGSNNIAIGPLAGINLTSGSNNILIGNAAGQNQQDGNNSVIIGGWSSYLGSSQLMIALGDGTPRLYINSFGAWYINQLSTSGLPGQALFSNGNTAAPTWEYPALKGVAPVTITFATYTLVSTDVNLIANRAGTITLTLPVASANSGRTILIKTIQNQSVVSASSNVVPLAGGAAGTAILAATAGKYAQLISDGTNWIIMQGN